MKIKLSLGASGRKREREGEPSGPADPPPGARQRAENEAGLKLEALDGDAIAEAIRQAAAAAKPPPAKQPVARPPQAEQPKAALQQPPPQAAPQQPPPKAALQQPAPKAAPQQPPRTDVFLQLPPWAAATPTPAPAAAPSAAPLSALESSAPLLAAWKEAEGRQKALAEAARAQALAAGEAGQRVERLRGELAEAQRRLAEAEGEAASSRKRAQQAQAALQEAEAATAVRWREYERASGLQSSSPQEAAPGGGGHGVL